MQCPRCSSTMTLRGSIGPRELFRCPHCGKTTTKLPQPTKTHRQSWNDRYRRRSF